MVCKKIMGVLVFIFLQLSTHAQERYFKIEGQVLNERLEPLPYTNLTVQGTATSTKSDENGFYTLLVKPNKIVSASHTSYETMYYTIRQNGIYNFILVKRIKNHLVTMQVDSNRVLNHILYEKEKNEENKIYTSVEISSTYKGDFEGKVKSYISEFLIQNPNIKIASGEVELNFNVQKDGTVSDVIFIKKLENEIDSIVKKALLKTSGGWYPSEQNGNNEISLHNLKFKIQAKGYKEIETTNAEGKQKEKPSIEGIPRAKEVPPPKLIFDDKPIPNDAKGKKVKDILKGYDFTKVFSQQMYQIIEKPDMPGFEELMKFEFVKYLDADFYRLIENKLYKYYANDDLEYLLSQQQKKGKHNVEFLNNLIAHQLMWVIITKNTKKK